MTLFNLLKGRDSFAIAIVSALSLFCFTASAAESKSAQNTVTDTEPIVLTQTVEADDTSDTSELSESELVPPDYADLQELRDFDHDLVDFTSAPERSYKQSFKDEVLAFCISSAYQDHAEVKEDALYTAAAIHSWSRYELNELVERVPPLVTAYLDKQYRQLNQEAEEELQQPQTQAQLKLLKCMDLYHSPELEELAKSYVIDPERSYAEDHSQVP